jgi:chromosome segregation ATPase
MDDNKKHEEHVKELQKELTNLKIKKASLILHSQTFNKLIRDLNNRIQHTQRILTNKERTYTKLQNENEHLKVTHDLLTLHLHDQTTTHTVTSTSTNTNTNTNEQHYLYDYIPDDDHSTIPIDIILRLNSEPHSISFPPPLHNP